MDKTNFASIAACGAFWNETMDFDASSLWNSTGRNGAEVALPTLLKLDEDGSLPWHLTTIARPENTTLGLAADQMEFYSPRGQAATVTIDGASQTDVVWSCSDDTLTLTGGVDVNGNPVFTLTIPEKHKADYQGGKITVTASLRENGVISDSVKITIQPWVNAPAPEITI